MYKSLDGFSHNSVITGLSIIFSLDKMHRFSSSSLDRTSFNCDLNQSTTLDPHSALGSVYGNSPSQHGSGFSSNPLEAYQQLWVDHSFDMSQSPVVPPLPASTDSPCQSLQPSLAILPTEIELDRKVAEAANPDTPYSQLLYDALSSAPGHKLPLRGISRWFEENTTKADNSNPKGWRNSIRYNLSKNPVSVNIKPF